MFACKHRAGAPVASHRSVQHAQPLYNMNEPALDSAGQPFATDRAFYALACSDCDSESYADAASDSTGEDQEQRKDDCTSTSLLTQSESKGLQKQA